MSPLTFGASSIGEPRPRQLVEALNVRFRPLRPLAGHDSAFEMKFLVRTACASDVAAMHRVRNSVRENRLFDPQRISEASYLPYIAAASAWVAETDSGLVGFAAVDGRSRRVWALFIDPGAEGAGVGRALHRRMLDWAHEQGIARLCLSTAKGTRAAEFYRRAGWKETGVADDGELLFEIAIPS